MRVGIRLVGLVSQARDVDDRLGEGPGRFRGQVVPDATDARCAYLPETLLAAYRAGVFPWSSDPVLTWWSPDPRAIFDLESWRPHRSVARAARRAAWTFSVDRDFEAVMRACARWPMRCVRRRGGPPIYWGAIPAANSRCCCQRPTP